MNAPLSPPSRASCSASTPAESSVTSRAFIQASLRGQSTLMKTGSQLWNARLRDASRLQGRATHEHALRTGQFFPLLDY